jgi:hypothetical protein
MNERGSEIETKTQSTSTDSAVNPNGAPTEGGCWSVFGPVLALFQSLRAMAHFYYVCQLPADYQFSLPAYGSRLFTYWGAWFVESVLYLLFTYLTFQLFLLGKKSVVDRFVMVINAMVCVVMVAGPFLPRTRNLLLACDCVVVLYWACYVYEFRANREVIVLTDEP